MQWLRDLMARLFGRQKTKQDSEWDSANYGKPSNAGDDFRNMNT